MSEQAVGIRFDGDTAVIAAGSLDLARYSDGSEGVATESPRPHWHSIRTPAGVEVSGLRPSDHPWHLGLSIAIANIDSEAEREPANLWGGPTWITGSGYEQRENNGRMLRLSIAQTGTAALDEHLAWVTADGRALLHETRTQTVREAVGEAGWVIEVSSAWRNATRSPLRFGSPTTAGRPDAGYGGFFFRGGQVLDGAEVLVAGSEAPMSADAARGRAGPWMALRSAHPSPPVTVAMAAHPANSVGNAPWFVRTGEGPMLCAAPFLTDEWMLAPAAEATWRWSLAVVDGRPATAAIDSVLAGGTW